MLFWSWPYLSLKRSFAIIIWFSMSTDSSVCGTKSLLIYWLKDDIVEWWHRVWHSKQYMIVWLQNRLTCDCSTHAPAFTGHVLNSSPPCSLATWFFGLFFHLAQSFFLKKYLGKEGQDGCKEGQHPPHSPDLGPNLRSNPLEMSLSSLCCPFLPGAHFYFMI